jgi:transketolase
VLLAEGKNVWVVSIPCVELFEEQDAAYRKSVLAAAVRKRLVVEASSSYGWHKYSGFDGDTVSINRFGASAPGPVCLENSASPWTTWWRRQRRWGEGLTPINKSR